MLNKILKLLGGLFDVDFLRKQIQEYDIMMEDSNFWNDLHKSKEIVKECKFLKDKVQEFENLENTFKYLDESLEIIRYDEDDEYIKIFKNDFSEFKN